MLVTAVAQLLLVVSGICAARILGTTERGELALYALVPAILTALAAFGTPIAATYFIARDTLSRRHIIGLVTRLMVVQTMVVLVVQLVILVIVYHGDQASLQIAALFTLLLGPGELAQDYGTSILQGEGRFVAFNISRILPVVAYAGAVLALLVLSGGSLLTVTLCYVIATAASGTSTLAVALSGSRKRHEDEVSGATYPTLREVTVFGAKSMLGAIYPTETFKIDQAFVGVFLSSTALGYYVVALSFVNLPRFVAQSIGMVAYPHIAAIRNRDAARRSVWKFVLATAVMAGLICALIAIAAPWIVPFAFGDEFKEAVPIVQLLLVSSGILALRRVLSDGMRGAGHPLLGTSAELTGLVVMFPMLAFWIPSDGTTGAAIALAIAAAVGFVVLLIGLFIVDRRPTAREQDLLPVVASHD